MALKKSQRSLKKWGAQKWRTSDGKPSKGRRMQQGEMLGKKYKFEAQEKRDVRKMNFLRGEYQTAKSREYGASMNKASAIGNIASGIGGIGDSVAAGFAGGGDFDWGAATSN